MVSPSGSQAHLLGETRGEMALNLQGAISSLLQFPHNACRAIRHARDSHIPSVFFGDLGLVNVISKARRAAFMKQRNNETTEQRNNGTTAFGRCCRALAPCFDPCSHIQQPTFFRLRYVSVRTPILH
jgi:hypothetical protein